MADENDQILDDDGQENINKTEKRIKDLSEKVKLTATERDELAKAKELAEQEKQAVAKERDFYKDFSNASAKYQGANEFQDKIKEKVMAGYDVEDATVAVLAKEGKLNPNLPKENPAGGSASNQIKSGDKTIAEMTKAEKREILEKSLDIS